MRFVAIDFETANERYESACSVGLAWIEDSRVVRVEERFIKPRELRFASRNIAIHGIEPEDVEDAPCFPEVMAEFEDGFRGAKFIAHNASFDMAVWRAASDAYHVPYPSLEYLCTYQIAKQVWPDLRYHRLSAVARHLGINFRHHEAGEDAKVCAKVALAAANELGVAGIDAIPAFIGLSPGRMYSDGYVPCSCGAFVWRRSTNCNTLIPKAVPSEISHILAGKVVVFTGVLDTMSRDEARQRARALGAEVCATVTRATNLVVAGPGAGMKLKEAVKRGLEVIDEDAWLKLIGDK